MFGLIRRISYSVIPRPDRPWADDPTSNAPAIGKKRRLSSTERDGEPDTEESIKKKARGESAASSATDVNEVPQVQVETQDVKDVTQGVKEVELTKDDPVVPAAIPLPEEVNGELDEPSSSARASPETLPSKAEAVTDDDASSVNDEPNDLAAVDGESTPSEKAEEGVATSAAEQKKADAATAEDVVEPETKAALPSVTKAATAPSSE